MEDLRFKHNSASSSNGHSISTEQLNRPIKLTLSTPKGQVNIKVNIISDQIEPINLSLVAHGSTSVHQLREMILRKMPQDMRQLSEVCIVLSIKKRQLDDKKYLFETLYELLNIEDDQQAEAGLQNRNQRMNGANLRRANQVDK